jgi:hypothetical protein
LQYNFYVSLIDLSNTRKQTDDQLALTPKTSTAQSEVNSLLAQLEEMNALDICNWLVDHPSILDLANRMLSAKSSTPHNEIVRNSGTTNNTISAINSVSVINLFK